jgi:hypothetical protein
MTQRVCIIGGGVAGVGLWWTLSQSAQLAAEWNVTLIHSGDKVGGHALTVPVPYKGTTIPVDTGVQFFIELLYPNIDVLVKKLNIPVQNFDELKVACAFPRWNNYKQNWGNFDAYRGTPGFELYTQQMYDNAERFQNFMDLCLVEGWGSKTLAEYFATVSPPYEEQELFLNVFVYPYLSIINGYGASLADQVTFEDLFPLFANLSPLWPGLGSFTHPGSGYRRFTNGASSLVDAMQTQAAQMMPGTLRLNTTVTEVIAAQSLPGPVTVKWTNADGSTGSGKFDKVILTTDMDTSRALLNNSANAALWNSLYSKFISARQWPLLPGKCYIHTDDSMLSPDLMQQQESLQFTAYYAPLDTAPYYDMFKTYTTYLQQNIHSEVNAAGLYLTMYGYIPDESKGDKVPDPKKVLFAEEWLHGMWLPTFMMEAKTALHMAQGKGATLSYPGQLDTGIYFAGNNTTADSLEHAFLSGAIIGNYAFDAPFPLIDSPLAYTMYYLFYHEFMFPDEKSANKLGRFPYLDLMKKRMHDKP